MPKDYQDWTAGDIFTVPLSDGTERLGQVLLETPDALDSAICAYTLETAEDSSPADLREEIIVAVHFTSTDLLDSGVWKVIGRKKPLPADRFINVDHLRVEGWIGAKIIGSGNIKKFLEACTGIRAWDSMHNPNYFERLLVSPDKKPDTIRFEKGRPV